MNIFTLSMAPVNPPYDDGVKNIIVNIAKRAKKHNFFFVSSLFRKAFPGKDNMTFLRSPFQSGSRHSMSFCQKIFVFLMIILNLKKTDIFQFFITPQPYFSKVFRKLFKTVDKKSIQVVSSIHTLHAKNREEDIPGLFFGDNVVTYSDFSRKKLEDRGVSNIVRIYPGVDMGKFDNRYSGNNDFGPGIFCEGGPNIIYPGTYKVLKESYSFELFCRIAQEVIENTEKVKFIMSCRIRTREDVLLQERFKRETERLGISENFSFLNTVSDMPALFNMCDMGIMPAVRAMSGVLEIPMVLLEMASMAKPVIYGQVPPLDELNDKKLGVMVDGGLPEYYSSKILQLLKDKDFGSKVGNDSREAVVNFFNIDKMSVEYEKLYNGLKGKMQ